VYVMYSRLIQAIVLSSQGGDVIFCSEIPSSSLLQNSII
jgi:hypothetical protein